MAGTPEDSEKVSQVYLRRHQTEKAIGSQCFICCLSLAVRVKSHFLLGKKISFLEVIHNK